MTQRESRLSAKIQSALREEDVFCFKVHGSPNMMAGLPDIITCVDGLFVGLEVKHPETRSDTSPRQDRVRDLITEAGGLYAVVCSVAEAIAVIGEVRRRRFEGESL